MSRHEALSVAWEEHPRCRQCDELFEAGRPRAAAIIERKVAGVFHEHCWPGFEAVLGRVVQAIVPYPVDPTGKTQRRSRANQPL